MVRLEADRGIFLMNLCHGGGEQRDEFESLSHFLRAGEGEQTVPQYLLFFPVLGGGEKLLAPHLDPAALQELGLSHGTKPAAVRGDLRESFLILSREII